MYGVTTKILENGNLEHICDILINILNIGFINIAIRLVSGFTVIDVIINKNPDVINIYDKCGSTHLEMVKEYVVKNPVITIIPKIGEAIMFEIINVKDTVLK